MAEHQQDESTSDTPGHLTHNISQSLETPPAATSSDCHAAAVSHHQKTFTPTPMLPPEPFPTSRIEDSVNCSRRSPTPLMIPPQIPKTHRSTTTMP